ncbi:MAG TPA: hypothetical protein VM533_01685 [Fimbriiglobus sp.]|jgi:hypothetical protein|nr:hypothetical protein [Fimbriiglobus sp.]
MARYVVTLGYILAAVLAPKLCCCALSHAAEAKPQQAAATEVRAKTCPHCHTTETAPDDANSPADKPKCPCKEGHSHEAPAVVTAPASYWLDAPTLLSVTGFNDRLPVPAFTASPFTSVPRTGPPLTVDDLLRAFHILRC